MAIKGEQVYYKEALDKPDEMMQVPANLIREMSERIGELENAVIDMRASLRACKNTSISVLDQHKDI